MRVKLFAHTHFCCMPCCLLICTFFCATISGFSDPPKKTEPVSNKQDQVLNSVPQANNASTKLTNDGWLSTDQLKKTNIKAMEPIHLFPQQGTVFTGKDGKNYTVNQRGTFILVSAGNQIKPSTEVEQAPTDNANIASVQTEAKPAEPSLDVGGHWETVKGRQLWVFDSPLSTAVVNATPKEQFVLNPMDGQITPFPVQGTLITSSQVSTTYVIEGQTHKLPSVGDVFTNSEGQKYRRNNQGTYDPVHIVDNQ